MLTEKQLQDRKTLVTATDISTLLGINPWSSPLQLYEHKKGIVEPKQAGPAAMWGHVKEPIIAKLYQQHHESCKMHTSGTVQIKKHFNDLIGVGATPDRICVRDHHAWLLECKSTGVPYDWTTSAPERHRYQAQWQMYVLHQKLQKMKVMKGYWKYFPRDLEDWYVDICCEHGNGMKVYREHHDKYMLKDSIQVAQDFAARIEQGVPPRATEKDADYLAGKPRHGEGTLDDDINQEIETYLEFKNAIKHNKSYEAKWKAHLLERLDDAGGIEVGTSSKYRISIKANQSRLKTDWESIALEMKKHDPQAFARLLEEHTKTVNGARVFRVKEVK